MALTPLFGGSLFDFPFGRGAMRDPMDFGTLMPSLSSMAPTVSTHPLVRRGDSRVCRTGGLLGYTASVAN
jgi:hypothetical protein